MGLVGLFGPVIDGHRVQERMKGGIEYRSRLLPRVVNVNNVQRSDTGVWNERYESLVQGNGKSPLVVNVHNAQGSDMEVWNERDESLVHVLREDLAEFIWVVGCPSIIPVPEIRQEVLLCCRCLKGLWGTVDKDAVELLQEM
jgi:hypothetical protein